MGKPYSIFNKFNIAVIIFVFFAFFIKSYFSLDPDFFWQIKIGEVIRNSGIPATDPFSYTMPSFPYINHEWFTSVFLNAFYYRFGWLVLSVIFSFIALLSVLVPLSIKSSRFSPLVILLASGTLFPISGVRAQGVTWLFFSVLITVLLKNYYKKVRYLWPLFFMIWANLHGGFAIGLVVLCIYLLINLWIEKKLVILDWIIFCLCIVFTFINPYGPRLWIEILSSVLDPSLKWILVEWRPLIFTFFPITIIYICLSLFLVIKFKSKFNFFEKVIYFGLLLAGILTVRHTPLWAIFTIPLFLKGFLMLEIESGKYKFGTERFNKSYLFLLSLTFIVFLVFLRAQSASFSFDREKSYPRGAVAYLKNNLGKGQILSDYNWGGYLILNLPEKKVFIDGRMPSWRMKEKPGESKYALREYLEIVQGKTELMVFVEKYNIDTVLLPIDGEYRKGRLSISRGEYESRFKRLKTQLEKSGWKIIYKDELAIVYRKN